MKLAVVISPKQESQDYEEDQQIQGNKNKTIQNDEREKNTLSFLENKCAKLVSRFLKKSIEIDALMYSYQNRTTVKEELMFLLKMLWIMKSSSK